VQQTSTDVGSVRNTGSRTAFSMSSVPVTFPQVTPDAKFKDDLGLDSLDTVEVMHGYIACHPWC
jgi:hypothetical protein